MSDRCEFKKEDHSFLYFMVFIVILNTCNSHSKRFDRIEEKLDKINIELNGK